MTQNTEEHHLDTQNCERGAALVVSILAMLLIMVLALALLSTGLISGTITTNARQQSEAYFISEAGLTHATRIIGQALPTATEFTNILQAGDGVAGTGDELSTRPSSLTPIPGAGLTLGNGRYQVFVTDDPAETDGNPNVDTNTRLRVVSVGTGVDGATATTEAVIVVSQYPAMLINGPLLISGNPNVFGTGGSIHSNGSATVSGTLCVSQYISSSATVTVGGAVSGAGCTGSGTVSNNRPIITPPTWDIEASFRNRADYVLASNGTVRDRTGNLQTMSGNDWNMSGGGKWTWDSGNQKWIHGGSALPSNKTWYSDVNMELASDFGTSASPKQATFIAEGSLIISANPIMTSHLDLRYAYMAGKDLAIGGNPTVGFGSQGIHYAGDQIKFNGDPRISGIVVSANLSDTNSPGGIGNPVPLASGRIEISGNARITYNGGLLSSGTMILSWREVRN